MTNKKIIIQVKSQLKKLEANQELIERLITENEKLLKSNDELLKLK